MAYFQSGMSKGIFQSSRRERSDCSQTDDDCASRPVARIEKNITTVNCARIHAQPVTIAQAAAENTVETGFGADQNIVLIMAHGDGIP